MSIHRLIQRFCVFVSLKAARHPIRCLLLVPLLSFALAGIGMATNFELNLGDEHIYAPRGSTSRQNFHYVEEHIPADQVKRRALLVVHADGENVANYEAMRRLFLAVNTVFNLDDYYHICKEDFCPILGPTSPWGSDMEVFEEDTQGSDEKVILKLSDDDLGAVSEFMGNSERHKTEYSGEEEVITYAESLMAFMELPTLENEETETFETTLLNAVLALKEEWEQDEDQPYRLEALTLRSISDEMTRAVTKDVPLLGVVFVIMTVFSCIVFGRRDPIQSRALLGFGSIVSILLSIMSGFGLAFIIGIPFTSFAQILPFVIFGVGMDDAFIITGAYFRTDPSLDPVERIRDTMEEVGSSICLTTITTALAFVLGCVSSSIPCVQWLCVYALPTVILVLLYQITFFVSIIVIDERRVQARRRDCCICFTVQSQPEDKEAACQEIENGWDKQDSNTNSTPKDTLPDRFMLWYGKQLLRPVVKVIVVIAFLGFMASCAYNIPFLSQSFTAKELLPTDSYVAPFLSAMEEYTDRKFGITVYFSEVDQSDPDVQEQMIKYIEDLVALPQIRELDSPCWVIDMKKIREGLLSGAYPEYDPFRFIFEGNHNFNEQLDMMLSVPEITQAYGSSIVRDENTGDVIVSKCFVPANYVDLDSTEDQVDFLQGIRNVTDSQPMNQDKDQFAFFAHDPLFFIWEFYEASYQELVFTTISGIVAVCVIAFLLMPHWTAVAFIFPLIIMLYVDLVGTLHYAGLSINPLTYIILVMSIGLLVDFIMHVLLKFYECDKATREEKVLETLRTMGSSIMLGGLSTCLGVVPLAFASSEIISTVFTMFMALVALGVSHGLIFLPVILSYVGPVVHATTSHKRARKESNMSDDTRDTRSTTAASTFAGSVQGETFSPSGQAEAYQVAALGTITEDTNDRALSMEEDDDDYDAPDDISC